MSLDDEVKSHSFLKEESVVGRTVINQMSFWWPVRSSLSAAQTLYHPVQLRTQQQVLDGWNISEKSVSVNYSSTDRFTATSWLLLVQVDTPECPCLSRCHSCRAGAEGEDTNKPSLRRLNPTITHNTHQRPRRTLTHRMSSPTGQLDMELSVLSGKRTTCMLSSHFATCFYVVVLKQN